jgi:hypothetical protein
MHDGGAFDHETNAVPHQKLEPRRLVDPSNILYLDRKFIDARARSLVWLVAKLFNVVAQNSLGVSLEKSRICLRGVVCEAWEDSASVMTVRV